MTSLNTFMFTYKDKEYDLHEIIGPENIYESDEFGKPIILKGGIFKLCQYFNFRDYNYGVTWKDLSIGTVCAVQINMQIVRPNKEEQDTYSDNYFIGDGEANQMNCQGVAAAHMQAMAIKRARSRAVLQELGIDAYGEEEAQEFEKKVPYEKALKIFLASSIINVAAMFETPMEKEAIRDNIRLYFGLQPEDKFTYDNLDAVKLIEFYGKLYHKLQLEKPEDK